MLDRHPLRPVPASNGLSLDELTEIECRARRDREKAARIARMRRLQSVAARCTAAHVEHVTATAGRTEWDEPYPWGACIVGVLTICALLWSAAAWLLGLL